MYLLCMRMFGVLFVCSFFSATAVQAGAWTLPEGEGQAIVTLAYSFASDAFDDDGSPISIEPFEKYELRGYAEYGLTDWATLAVQPEFRFIDQGEEDSEGLGRFDLGLRTRVWHDDYAVASIEGSVSAPGQSDDLAPLNGSDTDWELEARALYGRGFDLWSRHGFVDLQVGYRHRFSDPADEVLADLTFGIDVTERSLAVVQSFNRISVGSARLPFDETQEHKIAVSTVYRVDDQWSLQAGSFATAYGRNVLRERGFFVALWSAF